MVQVENAQEPTGSNRDQCRLEQSTTGIGQVRGSEQDRRGGDSGGRPCDRGNIVQQNSSE